MGRVLVLAFTTLIFYGCGGGSGSAQTGDAMGTLNIALTDAAVDNVSEVWVEFTGVTLKPQSGDEMVVVFAAPKRINLLDLQNGKTEALLPDTTVQAGPYNWIRLAVNAEFDNVYDSYAMLNDGSQVELRVPSGSQSGLKLVSGFTVTADQSTNIVIDWDLRKALTNPAGQPGMHLRPALRITDMAEYGTLTGTVAESLITAGGCNAEGATEDSGNAVYVYVGATAVVVDIMDAETDPVATANVTQDANGIYRFEVAYLSVGNYTAAFTCQAEFDAPETDDDIQFSGVINDVSIVHGETRTIAFSATP